MLSVAYEWCKCEVNEFNFVDLNECVSVIKIIKLVLYKTFINALKDVSFAN